VALAVLAPQAELGAQPVMLARRVEHRRLRRPKGGLAEINWDDVTEAAPVVVTALAMPLTYSIANGIAFGFISWTAVKLISGRHRDLNPALVILSILFVIKLGWFNA